MNYSAHRKTLGSAKLNLHGMPILYHSSNLLRQPGALIVQSRRELKQALQKFRAFEVKLTFNAATLRLPKTPLPNSTYKYLYH